LINKDEIPAVMAAIANSPKIKISGPTVIQNTIQNAKAMMLISTSPLNGRQPARTLVGSKRCPHRLTLKGSALHNRVAVCDGC
jgi:hypothetical protein